MDEAGHSPADVDRRLVQRRPPGNPRAGQRPFRRLPAGPGEKLRRAEGPAETQRGKVWSGVARPGVAQPGQERPVVDLLDLSPRVWVFSAIADVLILRLGVPQWQGVKLTGEPLQHEPGLHNQPAG